MDQLKDSWVYTVQVHVFIRWSSIINVWEKNDFAKYM